MSDTTSPSMAAPARESLASRLLHMVLYGVVFWILCWVVALTAIVQLALRAFGDAPSAELQRFGTGLARLAGQVIAYLSFASDTRPFPLGPFPDAGPTAGDAAAGDRAGR